MKYGLQRALLQRVESENECEGGYTIMGEMDDLLQLKGAEMLRMRKLAIANEGELDARRFQSEHRLTSAENKLEAATLRFNSIQGENKKIREEIEHMLKDRALFNEAWTKMITALGKGKKFLSDLFESSTLAYDQRDEWCSKLRSIQEKGRMEQMLQVLEMRDLKKAFDHETKIFNFLAKKGVKRVNKKQEQREKAHTLAIEKDAENQLKDHNKILYEIYDYCEDNSYADIIDSFLKFEVRNFSVYELLTHCCAENEMLARDLNRIRRDVEDRRDFNEMKTVHYQENIEKLQNDLAMKKKRTEVLRENRRQQDELINKIMGKIHEMFQMLECSLEPFHKLLGDKQPTVHTMKLTLLLITQKIKEYVEVVSYYERCLKRKEVGVKTSRLKKYTIRSETPVIFSPIPLNLLVPADPCPSCIESRWLSRVSETPEKPFKSGEAAQALSILAGDPAYMRSDRVHALVDCRATASRHLLATRHAQF